jgi:heptaprenyl diphosphate synthase
VVTSEAEFEEWSRTQLAAVEEGLREALTARSAFVTETARHLFDAGGKRFRPLLVLAAAGLGFDLAGSVDADAAVRAALVVELTHVASLYHDDVMDEAELRRGAPSANKRWENSIAILTGDFIFARASAIVATLGTDFVRFQADTFARLVSGQLDELAGPAPGADPVAHHLKVVSDKTASLIAASARFGAQVAGATPAQTEALTRFGESLGVVFQLSDDLIDIVSDDSGKSPGADLREGVSTLVTLLIRQVARPQDARLLELLAAPVAAADLPEALALVRRHPAVDQVRARVAAGARQAAAELAVLPAGPARSALAALCDLAVTRAA